MFKVLFRSLGPWPNNTWSLSDALGCTAETERSRVHGLIPFHGISVYCHWRPHKIERGTTGLLSPLAAAASQKEVCAGVVKNWGRKKYMSIKSKL